jgi:hypothetical protein
MSFNILTNTDCIVKVEQFSTMVTNYLWFMAEKCDSVAVLENVAKKMGLGHKIGLWVETHWSESLFTLSDAGGCEITTIEFYDQKWNSASTLSLIKIFPRSLYLTFGRIIYAYWGLGAGGLRRGEGARGSVVVKALCYKPEGRRFDSRWGEFLNLPNPSGRTRPWGLLGL